MTKSFIASTFCFLVSAAFCAASVPLIDEPVASLTLKNGEVLHDAQAKGFNSNSVLVKYDAGAKTVSYDQFPAEYHDALIAKKPALPKEAVARPHTPAPQLTTVAAKKKVSNSRLPDERYKGLALVSSSINGPSGNVGIYNDTTEPVDLDPSAIIAQLDNGKSIAGRRWVQVDAEGNPQGSMKGLQTLPPKTLTNLTVAFSGIPSGASIVTVFWNQN
jgi:hypothetical protein